MRQIVLDTETTGISTEAGHRIIEIGCVELINRRLSGKHYHVYINPERKVDSGAFKVHGISDTFLRDKPLFAQIIDEFIDFIQDSEIIIHNAAFDVGFLNFELRQLSRKSLIDETNPIIDSLKLARKKHPKQRNTLDALCKRYGVDNSTRSLHGALLDAELLAHVYIALTGGQKEFLLAKEPKEDVAVMQENKQNDKIQADNTPIIFANDEELKQHAAFMELLDR